LLGELRWESFEILLFIVVEMRALSGEKRGRGHDISTSV
jgi:hypothetical protein